MQTATVPILATAAAFLLGGCANSASPSDAEQKAEEKRMAQLNPFVLTSKDIPASQIYSSESVARIPLNHRDVIFEAHLDLWLKNHLKELEKNIGQADGKLLLGDFVMVQNGRELLDFVHKNGYDMFVGPTEVKLWPRTTPTNIEISLIIIGKNQKRMTAILYATGSRLGIG